MNLVNALRFMVALTFNSQVNNNFQYKLLKLFVALKVGFHSSIKSLCGSVHNFFFRLLILVICVMSTILISGDFF